MRVLVVDDHAIVRDGLERLLTADGGHEVTQAATGREALARARAGRPELIVLDLNLPGLGGLELLRRLARLTDARILVLSMHAEPLYARRALEAGAAGYSARTPAPPSSWPRCARSPRGAASWRPRSPRPSRSARAPRASMR
ncbi:MAG: response regulator transcription factor [Caulobacteraceae bacterium]|nr:response regulator transcription factor [Caulobacteraceae bacterium]